MSREWFGNDSGTVRDCLDQVTKQSRIDCVSILCRQSDLPMYADCRQRKCVMKIGYERLGSPLVTKHGAQTRVPYMI